MRSWTGRRPGTGEDSAWNRATFIRSRVQMAHHGMPLWADGKYKKKEELLEEEQGTAIGLCAWRLEFAHPKTGKKMKFEVQPEGVCFRDFL